MGNQLYEGYALMNIGAVCWASGHYDRARQMLGEGSGIAKQKGGSFNALQAAISLTEAQISLSERKFLEAAAKSQQALDLTGAEDRAAAVQGKYLLGLAQALSGRPLAGQALCQEATNNAALLGDPLLRARSELALAEAALSAGDTKHALESARIAQTFFAGAGLQESEWRALLIAGLASQRAGDHNSAKINLTSAGERLSSLQKKWDEEVFKSYLARPDIRFYRRQLDQSSTASH
jgi:hypothetical protein